MTYSIFKKFGGRDAAHQALIEAGYSDCTKDALRLWEYRKSIPGWGVVALMKLAKRKRIKYTPEDFEFFLPVESPNKPTSAAAAD